GRATSKAAHGAARDVLTEGSELSGNLSDLSDSVRRNAERLLKDVKLAHARLTAELDQATPNGGPGGTSAAAPAPATARPPRRRERGAPPDRRDTDFDIPEFLPGER